MHIGIVIFLYIFQSNNSNESLLFTFMLFTSREGAEKETVLKLDEYAGRPTEK
jgi:hypothetical protein